MSSTSQSAPSWQHGKVAGGSSRRSQADRRALPGLGRRVLRHRRDFDGADAAAVDTPERVDPRRQHLQGRADDAWHAARLLRARARGDRARDVSRPADDRCHRIALPGLAAAALWLFAFAGIAVVLSAFASGGSSKDGWTGYPPGTLTQEGNGVRLWLMGLFLLAVSVAASAVNLAAKVRSLRVEGMDWEDTAVRLVGVRVVGGDDRARRRSPRSGSG